MPESKFCYKCGAELPPGALFCPRCGSPTEPTAPTSGAVQPPTYTQRRERRHEKEEKQEKHEKGEKGEKGRGGNIIGPVIGGLILVWLGITFYLQQVGSIPSDNWWAYFVAGIGAILILQGILLYSRRRRPIFGPFIGGAILLFVGLAYIFSASENLFPLILVIIGVAILASALARSRTPKPV